MYNDESCMDTTPQKPRESPISSRCLYKNQMKTSTLNTLQNDPLETIDVLLQEIKSYRQSTNDKYNESNHTQTTKKETVYFEDVTRQNDVRERRFSNMLQDTVKTNGWAQENFLGGSNRNSIQDDSSTFTFYQGSPFKTKENIQPYNITPQKNHKDLGYQNKLKYKEFDNYHYFQAESEQVEQELIDTLRRLRDIDAQKKLVNRPSMLSCSKKLATSYYDQI